MTTDAIANAQQFEHWNETGQTWVALEPVLQTFMAPITAPLLDAAFPGAAKAVLDVGCGCGGTTLEMARRLGPDGRILGVDVSGPMLEEARRQAHGVPQAAFRQADAQSADLGEATFDAVMSRFGVMFFEDPLAAFRNLRRAVKPGGDLAFVCWRSPLENPFFAAPRMAVAHLLPPSPPMDPDAPGQFAFADPGKVRRILGDAGWTEVTLEPLDIPICLPLEDALTLMLGMGPIGAALTGDPSLRPRLETTVREAIEPYRDGDAVAVTSAVWLARARA